MKVYYAEVVALSETKYHIITANDEEHARTFIDDFWFDAEDTKIIDITELSYCGVQMTKHQ